MNQQNPHQDKSKEQRRFNHWQYKYLKLCSKNGDEGIARWNNWRKKRPNKEIFLEGAILRGAYLKGINLEKAYLENANLVNAIFCPEYKYGEWQKGEVDFKDENKGKFTNLDKSNLKNARLQKAKLDGASLREANMNLSCLKGATLIYADLHKTSLIKVNLQDSVFEDANIGGAETARCNLRRANFRMAKVDSDTSLWKPEINKCYKAWDPQTSSKEGKREYTDFQGVPLDSIRIDPSSKQLLEYNIRRTNWEQWYKYKDWQEECKKKRHIIIRLLMCFIRFFWSLSDYGRSTGRIIGWFLGLAIAFGAVYYIWGRVDPPGIVNNLFELDGTNKIATTFVIKGDGALIHHPPEPIQINKLMAILRAFYFSVVTMTTLGFGDMYANAQSIWGHILLTFQVILGYVLLGALVTRFAVLFTAGGPAGKFADEKVKGKKAKMKKNKSLED